MILDSYGREVNEPRQRLLARYDAAQTTAENAAHWSQATGWDADREASPDVRAILRRRSRYEASNNPWVAGMITTLAYDIIGTGPRLQVLTDKPRINNAIEADFVAWSKAIRLAAKLHTLRMAQTRDGEAFAVLFANPKLPTKIKLDLQLVEADCVRGGMQEPTESEVDGIFYDRLGNPTAYNIMPHPGSGDVSVTGIRVPAENVIHIFKADRPGLHRGVPELTPSLPMIALLRRYTLAMVKKMETSANISGVIETNDTEDDEGVGVEVETFTPFSLPRDAFAALPKGYRLNSHQLNNPTDSQQSFALQVKLEVARALNLPRNVALGDSSSYNYASGRMDFQAYDKHLNVERMTLETVALSNILGHWLKEFWALTNSRRIEPLPITWFWDGRAHVDPVKESKAEQQRLSNGTTTLAIECAKAGLDWEAVQDQRLLEEKRELQRREELGLPPKTVLPEIQDEPDEQPSPNREEQE